MWKILGWLLFLHLSRILQSSANEFDGFQMLYKVISNRRKLGHYASDGGIDDHVKSSWARYLMLLAFLLANLHSTENQSTNIKRDMRPPAPY